MKAYEAVRNYNILIKDLIEHLKFCMNTRSEMLHTEISLASKNPLTSLIIKNIIFDIDGEHFGFPKGIFLLHWKVNQFQLENQIK